MGLKSSASAAPHYGAQTQKVWLRRLIKKSEWGKSRIVCKCLTSIFKDSCGALNADVVDSVKLMEQSGLAARQTVLDDLKCGRVFKVCDSRSRTSHS